MSPGAYHRPLRRPRESIGGRNFGSNFGVGANFGVSVTAAVRDEGVKRRKHKNRDGCRRYAMAISRRRLATLKNCKVEIWMISRLTERGSKTPGAAGNR